MNGINAIVIIIIASFAIDRIVMGLLFILSFIRPWSRLFPDPEIVDEQAKRVAAEKKLKLIRFCFAAVLGILVLAGYGHLVFVDRVMAIAIFRSPAGAIAFVAIDAGSPAGVFIEPAAFMMAVVATGVDELLAGGKLGPGCHPFIPISPRQSSPSPSRILHTFPCSGSDTSSTNSRPSE